MNVYKYKYLNFIQLAINIISFQMKSNGEK